MVHTNERLPGLGGGFQSVRLIEGVKVSTIPSQARPCVESGGPLAMWLTARRFCDPQVNATLT